MAFSFEMSDSELTSRRQSVFGKHIATKWLIFVGDCENINDYLQQKSSKSVWILLHYLNSLLRSFGQVIFANNPISGFLILLAVTFADYKAMFSAVMTSSLAFALAKFLKLDSLGNLNGFFGYNPVLHAIVSVSLLPRLYPSISVTEPKFWLFLMLTTLFSIYVTNGMAGVLRYLGQHPVPCFTLPFNLLQFVLIYCLLNNSMPPKILSNHLIEAPSGTKLTEVTEPPVSVLPAVNDSSWLQEIFYVNETFENNGRKRKRHGRRNTSKENIHQDNRNRIWVRSVVEENPKTQDNRTHLDWGKTFSGTIVALSQVYGLNNVPGSVLMYLALVIYSPTTALFSYLGSLLGTLIGVYFTEDYRDIYDGVWGYNALLCAGGLAGFGFVLTVHSAFLAFTAVLFSIGLQHFMLPLFAYLNAPILTMPFNITTIFFLFVVSDSESALPRPPNLTFPEKHRYDFKARHEANLERYFRRARVSEPSKYDL